MKTNLSQRANPSCIWSKKVGDSSMCFSWTQRGFGEHLNISHATESDIAVSEKHFVDRTIASF